MSSASFEPTCRHWSPVGGGAETPGRQGHPEGRDDRQPAGEVRRACGRVLARAHARSGDAAAIADCLGTGAKVESAFTAFVFFFADQNQRDHAQLAGAVADGSIPGAVGWG